MSNNNSWRSGINAFIANQRVISTAELLEFGKTNYQIGERSIKDYLSALVGEDEVFKAYKGLYLANIPENPVTLKEVAPYINKDATVSLDTVFIDSGGESSHEFDNQGNPNFYILVPINNPNSPPKTGVVKTMIGNIHVHSLSDSILLGVGAKHISDNGGLYNSHTPEMASALAIYASNSNRSSYSLSKGNANVTFPELDTDKFSGIANRLRISQATIQDNLYHFQPTDQRKVLQSMNNLNEQSSKRMQATSQSKTRYKP